MYQYITDLHVAGNRDLPNSNPNFILRFGFNPNPNPVQHPILKSDREN